ncbi:MAG: GNAT family N-acetyltransferase, partial [Halioglobus sp.]
MTAQRLIPHRNEEVFRVTELSGRKESLVKTESRGDVFIVDYPGIVCFEIRKLDLDRDIETLHDWFLRDKGLYWGLQGKPLAEVRGIYAKTLEKDSHEMFIGVLSSSGSPAFLLERYQPTKVMLGSYY